MDKTSETNSSPENLQIPENWKFKERDEHGLKVRQIDLDRRFIAFDLLKDPHDIVIKPQYGDYFFDAEGNLTVERIYTEEGLIGQIPDTFIYLVGDQGINYVIRGRPEYFDKEGFQRRIETTVYFKETGLIDTSLANLGFIGQGFDGFSFGENFARAPNQKEYILTPRMNLDVRRRSNIEDWVLDVKAEENEKLQEFWHNRYFEGFGNLQPQRGQNGAIYLDKSGNRIFLIDWKIEENELEPGKGQFAVVSQTHVPSGIVKTLRAPLKLDLGKVKEAVFARPPYPKEKVAGRDLLVVPWTNIDQIVGASLSYSYPLPPPQK